MSDPAGQNRLRDFLQEFFGLRAVTDLERQKQLLTWRIMAGVLVWGLVLAIGAASMSAGRFNVDLRRGFILFGFVLLFLGFWALLLRDRQNRLK